MIASGGANQSAGIGFAIPVNTAKAVIADFAKVWSGAEALARYFDVGDGPEVAEQIGLPADYGLLIERVLPGGAGREGWSAREVRSELTKGICR